MLTQEMDFLILLITAYSEKFNCIALIVELWSLSGLFEDSSCDDNEPHLQIHELHKFTKYTIHELHSYELLFEKELLSSTRTSTTIAWIEHPRSRNRKPRLLLRLPRRQTVI